MTRYESGRAFEYRVKAYLEGRGFKVTRSAGSHSPIDLFAGRRVNDGHAIILAVQCKHNRSRFGPLEATELMEWAGTFGAIPVLAHNEKGHLELYRVTKTGLSAIAV